MKDKPSGQIMKEIAGLRPKLGLYIKDNDMKDKKLRMQKMYSEKRN